MVVDIIALPKAVISDIVSAWLNLRAVGLFDSAVATSRGRQKFEESLCATHLLPLSTDLCWTPTFVAWLIKRRIKWKELVVGKEFAKVTDKLERRLFQLIGKSIRAVTFEAGLSAKRVDTTLLNLCMFTTNLETCIVKTKISDGAVCVLLAKNPGLRVVSVAAQSNLLHRFVAFGSLVHLTELTLLDEVTLDTLHLFLELNPPNLRKLCLANCEFNAISVSKLQNFPNLVALQFSLSSHLHLKGCCIPNLVYLRTDLIDVDADILTSFSACFPSLVVLIIDCCVTVLTTDMLLSIFAVFPRLQEFSVLGEVADYTDVPLPPLATLLLLASATPASIATSPFALAKLHLENNQADFDIMQILAVCPALCDVGLKHLPVIAPAQKPHLRLQRLCVYSFNTVTDNNTANISGLLELVLMDCRNLTNNGLAALARNNPQLRVLDLQNVGPGSKGSSVTYIGLMAFLDHCSLLTSVTFLVNLSNIGVSSKAGFEADAMLGLLCRRMYPKLRHFVYNLA